MKTQTQTQTQTQMIRYLSRADVEAVGLPLAEVIDAVEEAFGEAGAGRTEMPPKPGIHPRPDAFIHAMPAHLPGLGGAGLKWISGYPQNPARGLPYITGLLILNDPDTGIPIAVMDATWITAVRTAAATAVAARFLARPESRSVGILGCGVQGRTNLEALALRFEIRRVCAYDIDPAVAQRFAEEMGAALDLEVTVVDEPRAAVCGLDLVVTAGPILKSPTPAIEPGWLSEGAFACALDFDSYWQPDAFREVDRLATDDRAQLGYYRQAGYFRETPEPYADLADLAAGRARGRQTPEERTLALNLGLAIEDIACAVRVLAAAEAREIGTVLPL